MPVALTEPEIQAFHRDGYVIWREPIQIVSDDALMHSETVGASVSGDFLKKEKTRH